MIKLLTFLVVASCLLMMTLSVTGASASSLGTERERAASTGGLHGAQHDKTSSGHSKDNVPCNTYYGECRTDPSGGADTCLTDIQQCEDQWHADTAITDRSNPEICKDVNTHLCPNPTTQCKVAAEYLTCLQTIQCSGDNENKVHTAFLQVVNDERLAHCV